MSESYLTPRARAFRPFNTNAGRCATETASASECGTPSQDCPDRCARSCCSTTSPGCLASRRTRCRPVAARGVRRDDIFLRRAVGDHAAVREYVAREPSLLEAVDASLNAASSHGARPLHIAACSGPLATTSTASAARARARRRQSRLPGDGRAAARAGRGPERPRDRRRNATSLCREVRRYRDDARAARGGRGCAAPRSGARRHAARWGPISSGSPRRPRCSQGCERRAARWPGRRLPAALRAGCERRAARWPGRRLAGRAARRM